MDYHLKPIEHFLSYYLRRSSDSIIYKLEEPLLSRLLNNLDIEFEKIKIYISDSYYSFDEEQAGVHFIRNHQRRIITIVNQIAEDLLKHIDDPESKKIIQKELSERLLELLKFLEQDYVHCLDEELNITTAFGNKKAFEFLQVLSKFSNTFINCDPLIKVAMEPIYTFIDGDKFSYTYARVRYLSRLMKELDRLNQKRFYGFKAGLINQMILINFNNYDFFSYLTKWIKDDISRSFDLQEKLAKLKLHLKDFRQKPSKRDLAFLPNRRNIKDQMVFYINEEIKYMEYNFNKLLKEKGPEYFAPKIKLNISKDQLALLIKVAKESGLIVNEELSPVIKLICKCVATKKQQQLSPKSLYNQVYRLSIQDPSKIQADLKEVFRKYI